MSLLDAPITSSRVTGLFGLSAPVWTRPFFDWDFTALSYLSDGDPVYCVPDVSGCERHLYAVASSVRPIKTTLSNGMAAATFDGTITRMTADSFGVREPAQDTLSGAGTLVVVLRPRPYASQPATTATILNGTGTNAPLLAILNDSTNHTGVVYVGGNALSNNSGQFMPSIMDNGIHVIIATTDGANTTVYVDGYYVSTITGNILGTALTNPRVGCNNGNSNFFAGEMVRMQGFSQRMTADEAWQYTSFVNGYFKLGLTLYPGTLGGTDVFEDTTTSDTSQVRIWTPAEPAANPVLVMFCHPQSGDRNIRPTYWAYPYIRTAMGLGWYACASDMGYSGSPGGTASSWGNTTAQNSMALLYAQMLTRIKGTPKVVLIGASMGGMASALAVIKGTLPVDAVYFIDPALSMWDMYKTSYSSSIDAGYGITASTFQASTLAGATTFSSGVSYAAGKILAIDPTGTNPEQRTVQSVSGAGPYTITLTAPMTYAHASGAKVSDYGTQTAGSDPMLASVANFSGKPVRYTASSSDTAVSMTLNTAAFQSRLSGVATGNVNVLHQGGHLAGGASNPGDFVKFLKSNGF